MANRTFFDVQSAQRESKIVTGVMVAGDSLANGDDMPLGVSSVSIDTTPNPDELDIVLVDKYNDLVGISVTPKVLGDANPRDVIQVTFASSNTVTLKANNDFVTGDELYVTLFLKNTSVAK